MENGQPRHRITFKRLLDFSAVVLKVWSPRAGLRYLYVKQQEKSSVELHIVLSARETQVLEKHHPTAVFLN